MTNHTQHLTDALMTTLDDLYAEVAALRERVDGLESARQGKAWMTRSEAAEYLRISTTKLDDMRGDGRLSTHHIDGKPIFHVDDLDALAERDVPMRLVS